MSAVPFFSGPPSSSPDDLAVLDNRLVFDGNRLDHLWFHVVEREAGREYELCRVVQLKLLRYLPQEARQDAGLLDTMRTALTGIYNRRSADYDPCMIVAGIFDPPLGVIQCYGAIGVGGAGDRDAMQGEALRNARLGMAALEGVMANFPQSRLESLDAQKANWLRDALVNMPQSLVVIGQPDPRLSARGMGREGPGEKSVTLAGETAYTMQQNEMLFRAMAQVQEEFVFVVLASRLAQRDLATMLEGIASEASVPASRQAGAKSISFGISLPLMASGNLGQSAGTNYGRSEGQSAADGIAESEATSHSEGHATTVGHAVTEGHSHTEGRATTHGSSVSHAVSVVEGASHVDGASEGSADSVGAAHTEGHASSHGGSSSHSTSTTHVPEVSSYGGSESHSQSAGFSVGGSHTESGSTTTGASDSVASGDTRSGGHVQGYDARGGIGVVGGGWSESASETIGHSESAGHVETEQVTTGASDGHSTSISGQVSHSEGESWSTTPAHTIVSSSSSHSSFSSDTHSVADTTSEGHTDSRGTSQADGVSRSVATTTARSSMSSTTHSSSDTASHSETRSTSYSESESDGVSQGTTRSHSTGRTSATGVGRALSVARSMGMSAGIAPSVSASKSYQWYDDGAIQLTALLRAQEELLRRATLEGAFLTDAYMLCRTERGAVVSEAALRQAFHGSEFPVVTPVQTRRLSDEEQAYIRKHAFAFTPSTREETVAGALEAYKDATMLLPLQLAAYMAPGLFEEGVAVTTQERTPPFAFVPDMGGDVILAHLWSSETGRLTPAQLRLSEEQMFHTAFVADTGFGKTVAAERLALETTQKWQYRTVVLDFGAGWRKMVNAPLGSKERVEVWQVFPGATAPLRWNPLQIGKRINPERQMLATCELVRNAGQMGPRQLGFLRRALQNVYLRYGVLTSYAEVMADDEWGHARDDEWEVLEEARCEQGAAPRRRSHLELVDLEPCERQALAVHRSKAVDFVSWHAELQAIFDRINPRQVSDRTAIEGILLRIEPFVAGEMERMYGRGEGSIAIEDLGFLGPAHDPWGISVLEGGAEMDEFAKAVVFSLVAWRLYNDAVVRRRLAIGRGPQRKLQIFFEEANKVLGGVAGMDSDWQTGGGQTSDLWLQMWRDGRKYGIWLHVIAQTVSELPPGILSSCNNAFFSQTKHPADRDLIMSHLAFSEKGFTDEDYKRFLSRMPIAQAICKLGYSTDVAHTMPFLCRPVLVPAVEPPDRELLDRHHRLHPGSRRI